MDPKIEKEYYKETQTLDTGKDGSWTAGGALASSGLKAEAMAEMRRKQERGAERRRWSLELKVRDWSRR